MSSNQITPTDEQVIEAIKEVHRNLPGGCAKVSANNILKSIKETYPNWILGINRTKKIVANVKSSGLLTEGPELTPGNTPVEEEEEAPVEEAKPVEEKKEEAPVEEAKPVEEEKSVEEAPAEEKKEETPAEETKPAEEAPVEEAKPVEEAPVEEKKEEAPVEAPVEEAKPAEEVKPAEEAPKPQATEVKTCCTIF